MSHVYAPIDAAVVAEETAKMLLEIEAVLFFDKEPFKLTSGWASPVYVDCRKIISYPRLRSALMDFAASTIVREAGYEAIDVIAGGETAGIPFAAWLSDRLSLPMQYVRKKPKGFGRNAQIEGLVVPGARTLLAEDLATDGRSKINFVEALRKAGATVDHIFVLFFWNVFPDSPKLLADLGVKMHYLTSWREVLDVARNTGRLEPRVIGEVESFLADPAAWSAANGGTATVGETVSTPA